MATERASLAVRPSKNNPSVQSSFPLPQRGRKGWERTPVRKISKIKRHAVLCCFHKTTHIFWGDVCRALELVAGALPVGSSVGGRR